MVHLYTDCLFETLVGAIRNESNTFSSARLVSKGATYLEVRACQRFLPDPKLLPWNKEVLE